MPCGCKGKKATATPGAFSAQKTPKVELGICTSESLPLLFRKGYQGNDVVVIQKGAKVFPNALNIYGRNAQVNPAIKEALQKQWPNKFC